MYKILFLILLTACHDIPNLKGTFCIDKNLPNDVIDATLESIQDWKNTTSGMVDVKPIICNGNLNNIANYYIYNKNMSSEIFGEGDAGTGIIRLNLLEINKAQVSRKDFSILGTTIRHEMGHVWGIEKHISKLGYLMSETHTKKDFICIDMESLILFCNSIPGCNVEKSGLVSSCK